ncbi:MAG TPA: DUF3592 domain-containing protein [Alphaproteobacteria bacterium]
MESAIYALAAWNQVGLIAAGLFMLALGGLLLAYPISRYFCCMRTTGRVVAVRATGIKEEGADSVPVKPAFKSHRKGPYTNEMYYALYEYTGRDGVVVRSEDGSGSNWLLGKVPGTEVKLMVPPDDPQGIYRQGFCMPLFGLMFTLPGLLMLYVAFAHFEMNIFTLVVGLVFIGWGGYKLSKHIKPRAEWDNRESFRKKRWERRAQKRSKGRALTTEEITVRVEAQEKTAQVHAPVLSLIGVIFIGVSLYMGQGMYVFMNDAVAAKGIVIRMENQRSGSDGSSYYPHVAFIPQGGSRIDFRDKLGTSPPAYKKGDHVDVLYDPAEPRHAMIDRGIWNWGMPGIFGGIGVALLLTAWKASLTLAARRAARKAL